MMENEPLIVPDGPLTISRLSRIARAIEVCLDFQQANREVTASDFIHAAANYLDNY